MKLIRLAKFFIDWIINSVIIWHYSIIKGDNVKINGTIRYKGTKNRLTLGDRITINSDKYIIPIGYPCKCSFWVINDGKITIGNNTGLSNTVICSMLSVRIGENCLIGGGVKIYDTDFHSLNYLERRNIDSDNDRKSKPVTIGDDVFIGAGTMILKGSNIGARAIIGAGSVVCGNVPEDEIWAGNPARFVKRSNNYYSYDK